MGLASSLSTALTGLNAAETQIDVLGNNLANSQTVGFKASDVVFSTQFLQTLSLGAAPTADNGGTDPRQTGLGVQVAGISPDFSQGTIQISSSPSDLAIQGDGLFIVQSTDGERLYTRNGIFTLNSENQLVTPTGQRLLGYGIDEQFNVQTTELVPMEIPLGTEAVAQATENVVMEGVLTPNGDVANTAAVIQSGQLGDAAIPRPDGVGVGVGIAPNADTSGLLVSSTDTGGSLQENVTYQYRIAYVDGNGQESAPSGNVVVNVPVGNGTDDNAITLDNLPAPLPGYSDVRVYRTAADGNDFFLLDTVSAGGTYVDDGSQALGAALDSDTLSGNYTYMITYFRSGEPESRPSPLLGPQNVVDGRLVLSDLPTPPVPPAGGGFPAYDSIRIYRNTASDQNSFYLVDTVAPGTDYIDSRSDQEISDLTVAGNQEINLDGPDAASNTLLTNLTVREGFEYVTPFPLGSLSFEGRKGGRNLDAKTFEVTSTSTLQDLANFMEEAMGIHTSNADPANPIPGSVNNIVGETGTLLPGAYIQNGSLRFVSNNGVDNALDIDLTSFRLTDSSGNLQVPNMAFGQLQEAEGQSAVADFISYDSLGLPIRTRITAVLESRSDAATVYRWFADSPDNSPQTGSEIAIGTGLLNFDGNGNFVSSTNSTVAIDRFDLPSVTPLEFDFDFSAVSGLATDEASLAASRQDGSPPGTLTSYVIGEDGQMRGVFSNGIARQLGQIRLARFTNPQGLEQRGQNLYAQGINTGLPVEGGPGENGIGTVVAGALELSNTDIGGDLVDLVLASTQYRSNARVITATQQLFDELLNLRR